MNVSCLKLIGSVSELSRPGLYADQRERLTLFVHGAEPLCAELRIPNEHGWRVGQRVVITIDLAEASVVLDTAA